MASGRLRLTSAVGSAPQLACAEDLLAIAAVRSSSLGHDLIHRFRAERFQLFLTGHLALWASAAIVLPLWEYFWLLRSPWFLAFVAVGAAQCVVLAVGLRLARRGRYQQSITLVCIGTWVSRSLVTLISPPLLPAMVVGGAGARRLRRALHQLAARAGVHRDHRGLRPGHGCAGALHPLSQTR